MIKLILITLMAIVSGCSSITEIPKANKVKPINVVPIQESNLSDGAIYFYWNSEKNEKFTIYGTTNLIEGFSILEDDIKATPPTNSYSEKMIAPTKFYQVGKK